MTIVAHAHPFVIGVDTHARTHTLAALVAATGELIATEQFSSTDAGMDRAIAWAARHTNGDLAALRVIEGIATYAHGTHLTSAVNRVGYEVVEAARMDARAHRDTGKPDPLDAIDPEGGHAQQRGERVAGRGAFGRHVPAGGTSIRSAARTPSSLRGRRSCSGSRNKTAEAILRSMPASR